MSDQQNAVSHPSHYTGGGIECKDAMAAMMGTHYCLQPCANGGKSKNLTPISFYWWACAFKYLWRWDKKNGVQDLEKCKQCIDFLIDAVEEKTTTETDDLGTGCKLCYNLSELHDCDCFTCSHCGASFQVEQIEYDDDLFCSIESAIDECEAIYRDCDVFFCPHCGYENAGAD